MTQQVLQNEITDLTPDRGVDIQQRRSIADALSGSLADAFRISLNLQGLHWNVEGPLFFSIHKLTEEQYQYLARTIDELAERIRAIGMPAPQTLSDFIRLSRVDDLPEDLDLKGRIDRVISDYERAVERMAVVVRKAEEAGDIKTADLLTEKVGAFDEFAWMLRATVASGDDRSQDAAAQARPAPRQGNDERISNVLAHLA